MDGQAIHRVALFFMAAAAAVTSSLWAQHDQAPAAQRTADTTLAQWLTDKDERVSELIGTRVTNPSGEDLGEVEDIIAKAGSDNRPVVVLSIGGVLDVGDKWHAASLDQLRIAPDNERLLLDKSKAELKEAPNFDYVPMIGDRSHQPGVRGPNTTNSVGRLLGATVVDDAGESIGEIKDFVVSTGKQGTRAVVGLDAHAGAAQGRLVAVPFDALHIELSGEEARAVPQQARVRVSGTSLEALPAYEYPQRETI
jgi:sporulation protein YlmC with PRC-barrel domain